MMRPRNIAKMRVNRCCINNDACSVLVKFHLDVHDILSRNALDISSVLLSKATVHGRFRFRSLQGLCQFPIIQLLALSTEH